MNTRNLNQNDTAQIIELEKQLWYFFDSLLPEPKPQAEVANRDKAIEQGLSKELSRTDSVLQGIVLEADNRLIGYLLYTIGFDPYGRNYDRVATFISLFVKEEYRGKGGLKLMFEGFKSAQQNDCKEAFLIVWDKNKHAKELYEKIKFQTFPKDLIWMKKDI